MELERSNLTCRCSYEQKLHVDLLELPERSRAKKLIFGLQFNVDKTNSRRYYVTWYKWYSNIVRPLLISVFQYIGYSLFTSEIV